jgi:hypothetical protein
MSARKKQIEEKKEPVPRMKVGNEWEPWFLVTFKISSYELPDVTRSVGAENLVRIEPL